MDWWTKLEGEEQESCIKGRRVTKSPATYWNAGRFTSVIVQGPTREVRVEETMLPRRRANKSQQVTLRHVSH